MKENTISADDGFDVHEELQFYFTQQSLKRLQKTKTNEDKQRKTAGTENPIGTDETFLISRDDKCFAHSLQPPDEGKRSYLSFIDRHCICDFDSPTYITGKKMNSPYILSDC